MNAQQAKQLLATAKKLRASLTIARTLSFWDLCAAIQPAITAIDNALEARAEANLNA